MEIGIPKEVKPLEGRVSLTPDAVAQLVSEGHSVKVEKDAGLLSAYSNDLYEAAGAILCDSAKEVYCQSRLIVKVKDPVAADLEHLNQDHLLFSFLHLAAMQDLTKALVDIGLTAVAFETVEDEKGKLPLLAPMSQIAGKVAIHWGAHLLHYSLGGSGLLLGGIQGTEKGEVTVLGGGEAGRCAAQVAAELGANVVVFDINPATRISVEKLSKQITALDPAEHSISERVRETDLLVGSILIKGAKAPKLVSAEDVKKMKKGSVVIDIAVDQGGCIETTRPTDYRNPTYTVSDVIHMGVTNMPGAVPRTSSQALSNAILPYVKLLASDQLMKHSGLKKGINVMDGKVVYKALLGD